MARHRQRLTAPALVAVGQAFDIIAGRTLRAPDWMGAHGLEWLYRLACDPRRLWKRYLGYNTLFFWYLFLQRIGKKFDDSLEKTHSPTHFSPDRSPGSLVREPAATERIGISRAKCVKAAKKKT
jgi:hypothetical protein